MGGMMLGKLYISNKRESAAPAGIIVSRAAEKLKSIPTRQTQDVANGEYRQQMIVVAYSRAERHGFKNVDEVQGWLDAEVEIDGVPLPGKF